MITGSSTSTSACRCSCTACSPTARSGPPGRRTSLRASCVTGRGGSLGDVCGADRAEQFPFGAGLGDDVELEILDGGGALLCPVQLLVRHALQFGATGFEAGNVRSGRERRLALGQQEIAPVTGLHLHPVADVAEVGHFLQQYEFHGVRPQC